MKKFWVIVAALLVVVACRKESGDFDLDTELSDLLTDVSGGQGESFFALPASTDFASIPQDPNNPLSLEKVQLGELLFHETAMATNPKLVDGLGTYSCASCHHAGAGFQANVQQGISEGGIGYGVAGEMRRKNPLYPADSLDVQPLRTPSAMNSAYQELMLWNGQFGATGANTGTDPLWTVGTPLETNNLGYEGVEIQAIAGLKVHRLDVDTTVLFPLGYKTLFDQAFPGVPVADRYSREYAGLAIAAYERTILANQAPFQEWLAGERDAMTDLEKEGAILFFGDAGCVSCHTGPALNSMDFYALGMNDLDDGVNVIQDYAEAEKANRGRGGFTGNAAEDYQFKVPQLYNLTNSPFYGHGGTFTSVLDVIAYKNVGIAENANVPAGQLAAGFQPLNLTAGDMEKLTLFLEHSLYDPNLARYEPDFVLSGQCIPNNDIASRLDRGCQ